MSLFFFVWLELPFCGISSFCLGTKHEPPSAPVHLRPQSREPTTRPCSHTTTFARSDSGWDIIQSSRSSVFFFLFLPQRRRWDVESARQGPHAVFGPQAQLPSCKTITSTSCRSRRTYIVLTKARKSVAMAPRNARSSSSLPAGTSPLSITPHRRWLTSFQVIKRITPKAQCCDSKNLFPGCPSQRWKRPRLDTSSLSTLCSLRPSSNPQRRRSRIS